MDNKVLEYVFNNIECYHSSVNDIDGFTKLEGSNNCFSKSPFGMHLALNIEAAENRTAGKRYEMILNGENVEDEFTMLKVKISAKRPLELPENDAGRWTPDTVLSAIMKEEVIDSLTNDEIQAYYDESGLMLNGVDFYDLIDEEYGDNECASYEEKTHMFMVDWIKSKGYDSIIYENDFEG